ncbi:MAG: hypothetical protein ACREDA_07400, partial [Methylocella sp.]
AVGRSRRGHPWCPEARAECFEHRGAGDGRTVLDARGGEPLPYRFRQASAPTQATFETRWLRVRLIVLGLFIGDADRNRLMYMRNSGAPQYDHFIFFAYAGAKPVLRPDSM